MPRKQRANEADRNPYLVVACLRAFITAHDRAGEQECRDKLRVTFGWPESQIAAALTTELV